MIRWCICAVLGVAVGSCAKGTATPTPSASASASAVVARPTPPPALDVGPSPRPERDRREAAVLEFLTGDARVRKLPVVATEPGLAFDRALRDRLAPRGPRARVIFQPPKVEGGLSRPIVHRVIRRAVPALRGCYEDALEKNPDLAGRVEIVLTVGANGAVTSAATQGARVADATMVACVLRAARNVRFPQPAPGATTKVIAPIVFAPK